MLTRSKAHLCFNPKPNKIHSGQNVTWCFMTSYIKQKYNLLHPLTFEYLITFTVPSCQQSFSQDCRQHLLKWWFLIFETNKKQNHLWHSAADYKNSFCFLVDKWKKIWIYKNNSICTISHAVRWTETGSLKDDQ